MKINSVFHKQLIVPPKCGPGRGGSIAKADGGAETAQGLRVGKVLWLQHRDLRRLRTLLRGSVSVLRQSPWKPTAPHLQEQKTEKRKP